MYLPPHFEEPRREVLFDLIEHHPMGVLVTHGKSGLNANHIPFILAPAEGSMGVLHAHVARANPVWQDVADGDEVLAIFRAEDAYISPNWYPSKHETHRQVPTWNYRVVHAHGRITILDDTAYVRGVVARLTRIHEARVSEPGQARPWKMTDSSAEFIDHMLARVVGLRIDITRLEGKAKLSQNKTARDIRGAAGQLKKMGRHAIGDAMLEAADRLNPAQTS